METEEQIKIDQQDRCYKMFNDIIDNAPPILISHYREDVFLYAPKICIDYLKEYFSRNTYRAEGDVLTFRGYSVKESYMPEIALVHKDYPLFLSKDMISKISIG